MRERDKGKVEPFWARPARGWRRASPPLAVPERKSPDPEPAPPPQAPPAEEPHEPSFAISRERRREEIAALIADQIGPLLEPAPPRTPAAAEKPRPEPAPGRTPPEASPAPAARGWVGLSAAEAARHPLFGVHGWVVLVAVFVAVGLFRALVELVDFWATTDHGGLAAWIMAILRSVMALWAALILGLLMGRSRAFPTNFVAYGMVDTIYLVLFGLAFAHVTHGAVFIGVAVAIPLNLLAIAYVLRSRRVNVTFRHRVLVGKPSGPPRGEAHPEGADASPA